MPYRRRSGSKKSLVRCAKWIGIAALFVLAFVAIGLVVRSFLTEAKVVSQKAQIKPALAEIEEPSDAGSEMSGKYFGLCKKESIHSVEDFRRTVRNDAVLSAHFSGFNWEKARLGEQEKDIWAFVSFRKGEQIRRTSKPVRLPKGDGYVSDGVRIVRTYCCNDYVIAPPPLEVSMASPSDIVERVDGPPRRMIKNPELVGDPPEQLSSVSPAGDPGGTIPGTVSEPLGHMPSYSFTPQLDSGPGYVPYSSSKHGQPNNETPPIVTPEPGTFFLVGGGMAVLSLFGLLRRKRTRQQ